MITYQDRELRDSIHTEDPMSVSHRETRTTDVKAWLRNLDTDVKAGAIVDPVVYLSVVSHLATINDVTGHRVIGGERESESWRRRNVEVSYTRYDTIQKLSVYCGVISVVPKQGDTRTPETAEKITHYLNAIQVGLSKHKQLQVRSGLSLHLHSISETWSAGPEDAIEEPELPRCVICNVEIHQSNGHWRGPDGKYEVLIRMPGEIARGLPKTRLGHYHRPEGVVLDEDGFEVAS